MRAEEVNLGDARRVHAALAHQLLGVWDLCSRTQQLVQAELDAWPLRTAESPDQYLRLIADRLRTGGAEQQVVNALAGLPAEYRCVDQRVEQMFKSALALTRQCYQTYADWAVPDVRLEIAAAVNPVYPDHVNFGELGVVACVPPRLETDDPATVKLTFVPSLLGPPSWASVPYLLCHELICHVNQAAPASSEDPFAEGWMDMVALQLHQQWAPQIFPWAPQVARDAASRLSDAVLQRWRGLPEPHMTARALRVAGRSAAKWVDELLQPFDDRRQVVSEMIQLSLQLNRVSPTVAGRLEFVSKVNDGRFNPALKARLLACLRLWADDAATAEKVLSLS